MLQECLALRLEQEQQANMDLQLFALERLAITIGIRRSSGSSAALTGATGLSTAQMKAVSGTYPSALGDQFIFTSGSYPKLKYGGKADGHCGGSTNVTCGAAIRGQ